MKLDRETLRRLQEIEREFHRRAFGEELARVNFLPVAERRRYAARLRRRRRSAGSKSA